MTQTPGEPASVPVAQTAGPEGVPSSSWLDFDNLKPGARWRGLYQIGEQLPDVTHGRSFTARHISQMHDVVLRVFKVRDDTRAKTWEAIKQARCEELLELMEAVESDGRRVEIERLPPRLTLHEWAGRRRASQAEIILITRQLVAGLAALHRQGIVHLNLRTDAIHVQTTEGGLNVVIGGFEQAQLIKGVEGLADASVDSYFAPPEAIGLYSFTREPALRAWDWWSLGRVLQQVVLGVHILGHMLERDVTRQTPELKARAESLLKEENQMVRAGAVEMMPAMDREINTLLRGLLTTSRDGRWGLSEVEAWLRKEPVKDRYHLARHERLFVWKDRAYTLTEAAEHFGTLQHWHEGAENLFDPTCAGTLAYFIGRDPLNSKLKERFALLQKLSDAPELQHLPADVSRDVLQALLLKFLAGAHAPLQIRGSRIDLERLRELLTPASQPSGLALVLGLTSHAIVQQVEQLDAETGHMLAEVGRIHEAALKLAQQNRWLPENDVAQYALLVLLCTEPELTLSNERAVMLKTYACSRDPVLDRLYKKADASHAELAVIVHTNRNAARHRYVTHREWNEEQHRLLRQRGEQLSAAITWLRLGSALKQGPLIFGRFRFIVPFWFITAVAVTIVWWNAWGCLLAVGCPALVVFGRLFGHGVHGRRLKNHVDKERPWTLRSGWWHCRHEALMLLQADTVPGPKALLRMFKDTNEQIGKLDLEPKPQPVAHPLHFRDTRTAAMASTLLFLAVIGISARQAVMHPPKLPDIDWSFVTRWFASDEKKPEEKKKPVISLEKTPAGGLKSMQGMLEELRRKKQENPEELKVSWPFKAPAEAHVVRLKDTPVALPEQNLVAEEFAALVLDRYEPATIKDLVAVQVPVPEGVGLMLYNGRTGKLAGKKVYIMAYVPLNKSWLDLDSNKAIFLNGQ